MMQDHQVVFSTVAAAFAGIAALWDVQTRRIPNLLCAFALGTGLLLHFGIDGWHGMLTSLAAGLIAGSIFLVFFLAGGMGGGDVKLIAGIAALCGLPQLSYLLVFTALAGGAMALALIIRQGAVRSTLQNVGTLLGHHLHSGLTPHEELNVHNQATLRLPYGLAIAAGAGLTLYLQGNRG